MARKGTGAQQMDYLTKQVEQLLIIVAGSSALDKKGLMQSQREDEDFKKIVLENFEQLKKENSDLKRKVAVLDGDIQTIKGYFRLPTTKKFWQISAVLFILLILFSGWTRDLYTLVWSFVKKNYL